MTVITNSINNRIGASNTGVTNTLTVDNTSNTASSQAQLLTNVGGVSSGDPFFTSTVTGGSSWSFGTDNSDSDSFVISQSTALGTNNIIRSTTAGEINFALTPCFMAYLNATASNVTGDNTTYTIVCATEVFDQNADYDTSTGLFTAPVDGRYIFSGCVTLADLTVAHTTIVFECVTTARVFRIASFTGAVATVGGIFSESFNFISNMAATQTAYIRVRVAGSTLTVDVYGEATDAYTFFSGKLLA